MSIPNLSETENKKLEKDLKVLVDRFHKSLNTKGYKFKLAKLVFHPEFEFGHCANGCPGEFDPATNKLDCSRC